MTPAPTSRRPTRWLRRIFVRRAPGSAHQGIIQAGDRTFPCALGRGGIRGLKREGDGITPAARMKMLAARYRADQVGCPRTALPLQPIRTDDGWCDAPDHPAYNRPVRLPFAASHEKIWREDALYDRLIVLDWNISNRARWRGSAIFLHQARSNETATGFLPTEGCIALKPHDMLWLMAHIGPGTEIIVLR